MTHNKKTVINFKIDKATKEEATELAERMGISLSAVMHSFLRHFIQTQELHITAAPRMTPYLEKIIGQAEADWKAGKNISPAFDNAKDAMKWLNRHSK